MDKNLEKKICFLDKLYDELKSIQEVVLQMEENECGDLENALYKCRKGLYQPIADLAEAIDVLNKELKNGEDLQREMSL